MATYIQHKFDQIVGDGARASKFDIGIAFNNSLYNDPEAVSFMAKATSFPGKSHETIDLKYKGRSIPIKGQTKYEQTWECTFYLTQDHKLKHVFETWIESLDQKHNYHNPNETPNLVKAQNGNYYGYTTEIVLYQKDFDGSQNTAMYQLFNAFPIEVTAVEMNAESVATVTEFTVKFAYSHYKSGVLVGTNGNFVDELVGKFKNGLEDIFSAIGEAVFSSLGLPELTNTITKSFKQIQDSLNGSLSKMKSNINDIIGQ